MRGRGKFWGLVLAALILGGSAFPDSTRHNRNLAPEDYKPVPSFQAFSEFTSGFFSEAIVQPIRTVAEATTKVAQWSAPRLEKLRLHLLNQHAAISKALPDVSPETRSAFLKAFRESLSTNKEKQEKFDQLIGKAGLTPEALKQFINDELGFKEDSTHLQSILEGADKMNKASKEFDALKKEGDALQKRKQDFDFAREGMTEEQKNIRTKTGQRTTGRRT